MKKKQAFAFGALLSVAAVCTTTALLTVGGSVLNHASTDPSEWTYNHYSAVAPTFESNGSKEYWISCDDPEHNIHLEEPAEHGTITHLTPTESFVKSLASSDSRYSERYHKAISFEDGNIPSVISFSSGSGVVSDEAASLGTKSLKIVGDFKLQFSQDFLDKFNALYDDDDCILFDIKASAQCKNLYYSSTDSSAYNVHRYDGVVNQGNDGVTTNWKTFAFKKSFLTDLNNREVIRVDNSNGATIYIDNIRIGKQYLTKSNVSFEDSTINGTSTPSTEVLRLESWSREFKVTAESLSSSGLGLSISGDYASEGHNSLHVTTTAETKISAFIEQSMYNATEVGFLFDLYTPTGAGISNVMNAYVAAKGGSVNYTPQNFTTAGKWITFFVPKSAVYNDTGTNTDYMLFRFNNSIVTDIYLDNIRLADGNIDFEHGDVVTFNTNRYAYASNYSGNYFNADLGAKNGTDIWYQGNFNVSLSEERSTNGAYSLKSTVTVANSGLYISKKLYDQIGEGGLSMDMYATAAVNFNSLVSGQKGLHDWNPGEWIKLVVPKAYIGQNGSGEYCLFTYAGITTTYIDNVHVVAGESNNSDLVTNATYNWYN